jgi:hypothetical protein
MLAVSEIDHLIPGSFGSTRAMRLALKSSSIARQVVARRPNENKSMRDLGENSKVLYRNSEKGKVLEDNVLILRNFLFISINDDGKTLKIHRLVQLVTLEWSKLHR